MAIRTLLVDDEPAGLHGLKALLASEPDVEVVGTCANGAGALAAIRDLRPDLLFLDIHLPDMDGFEVLARLEAQERPLVVFSTAFDQHTLRAFSVHALDYILKPPEEEMLRQAVARAREILAGRQQEAAMQRLQTFLGRLEQGACQTGRFIVRDGDRLRFISAEDIYAIEATGNYMHLHMEGGSCMVRETLATLESRLDPRQFVRTHKSWIVNLSKVREIQVELGGTYTLLLPGGTPVPVSRGYRKDFDALIKNLVLKG